MKHLLFLVVLLPYFICAQNTDQKYLEGSVPVVNGKVVFQKDIQLASRSKADVFDIAKAWAAQRFDREDCRVVYENPDKGELAAAGKEYIVGQEQNVLFRLGLLFRPCLFDQADEHQI